MIDLPRPLTVVCHDAGATNLILPWLDQDDGILPVMEGPAAQLWKTRFGDRPTYDFNDALARAASLLSGTGWGSDIEHRARTIARDKGLRSVAVLDHWVNYRERFSRDGAEVLPDALWVTDEDGRAIATTEFPGMTVQLQPNSYLDEQVSHAPPLGPSDRGVLFVAEPVRSTWGRDRPGEFQALDYLMQHRDAAGIPSDAPVRLRPHPSDPPGKFDDWLAHNPSVQLDRSAHLAAALAGVRWVVGCDSYALVVALQAGRKAISALPPWAPPCRLPQAEILRLAGH